MNTQRDPVTSLWPQSWESASQALSLRQILAHTPLSSMRSEGPRIKGLQGFQTTRQATRSFPRDPWQWSPRGLKPAGSPTCPHLGSYLDRCFARGLSSLSIAPAPAGRSAQVWEQDTLFMEKEHIRISVKRNTTCQSSQGLQDVDKTSEWSCSHPRKMLETTDMPYWHGVVIPNTKPKTNI